MRTCAPDQRIKIFFPDADGQPPALPHDGWLATYQAMNPDTRPPRRTYTIRTLRARQAEVDVEFVLHGATGPASRWAIDAKPGDRLQIVAPNRAYTDDPGGYEWRPPANLESLALIADETALPAIAGILEELAAKPNPPHTQAFLEVPTKADRIALATWPGLELHWLPREHLNLAPGEALVAAARNDIRVNASPRAVSQNALPDIDVDRDILWETTPAPSAGAFYAWVAGEAAAVKTIRQNFVVKRGWDRRSVALMGYWRLGKALD